MVVLIFVIILFPVFTVICACMRSAQITRIEEERLQHYVEIYSQKPKSYSQTPLLQIEEEAEILLGAGAGKR